MRIIALVLALLGACGYQAADAQSSGPGNKFYVNTATMLSGAGTTASPLTSTLSLTSPIVGTGSAGSAVAYNLTATGGYFGTGVDGACNFNGIATVLGFVPVDIGGGLKLYPTTRDINCTTIDMQDNVLLEGPYRVTASVSINLHSLGWIGSTGRSTSSNSGGGTWAAGSLCGGSAGGNGGTGVGANGTGASSNMPRNYPGTGGGTQAGGAGVSAGGSSGASGTILNVTSGDIHATGFTAIEARTLSKVAVGSSCGSGGGAGGGGGAAGRLGGGGGGGAGMLVVAAPTITGGIGEAASQSSCGPYVAGTPCLGVLSVHGGNAGNGTNSATATGGGGGGSGGILVVIYAYGSMPGYEIWGGFKGLHGSGGGSDGNNGKKGMLIKFKVGDQ